MRHIFPGRSESLHLRFMPAALHCRSYPWPSSTGAAAAFERANAALVVV